MRETKSLLLTAFLLFCISHTLAQTNDTILARIKTNGSDTSEARKYITAGEAVYLSDLKKAVAYWKTAFNKANSLSEKYEPNSFIYSRLQNIGAEALNNFGYAYNVHGYYDSALYTLNKSLEIKLKHGSKIELADVYNNIAFAQTRLGNYAQSINNHLQALRIREDIKNTEGIAVSYLNIASMYERIGDEKNSINNYRRSLEYYKIADVKSGLVNCLNSFAVFSIRKKNYREGKGYLDEALAITKDNNLFYLRYITFHNLGFYHQYRAQYDTALDYYNTCFRMYDSIGSYQDAISELVNIASCYYALHRYKEALLITDKALKFNSVINDMNYKKSILETRWKTFKELGMTSEALQALIAHSALNDSLNLLKVRDDAIRKQMQFEYGRQNVEDSLKFQEQKKLDNIKLSQQKTVSYFSIFAVALLIVVVFLVFRNLRTSKKNNQIISEQKILVEEKNKEITDSINYAKRLQKASLSAGKSLAAAFEQSFILYKPKDIVSGDFYWLLHIEDKPIKKNIFLLAAADCTGHGVPGAFMSMLNSTLLNQTTYNPNINTPADALNFLNRELPKNLRSADSTENINDGMDIAFCLVDLNKNIMKYSGANNPCWIVRDKQLIELEPLKQAISASTEYEKKQFVDQEIVLKKNDCVYVFTDGYADQFGGPKGKKFKYKTLSELLVSINDEPFEKQRDILEQRFNDWKGELEQVDDVLILGIKI